VVVTGGANECSTDSTATPEYVIAAHPGVTTTLLGVGPGLFSDVSLTQPYADTEFVGSADPDRIEAALARLAGLGAPCTLTVPTPPRGTIDYYLINVTLIPFNGAPEPLYNVPDATACALNGGLGWRYDDTADPRKIVLCDASCNVTPGAQLEVVLGCPTKVAP
jgi:hypothetical protein